VKPSLPVAAAAAAAVFVASTSRATPPATAAERATEIPGVPAPPPPRFRALLTVGQATDQMKKIAAWDVTMQSTACAEPDAGIDAGPAACESGGIIEVESGPGNAIIASDNTQETIGIWSVNEKLNGVANRANIAAAFRFLSTHPGYLAWQIAGDPGPDYYSVYNCGWGVRAVMLYEATTGDTSQHAYGETCAQHIATNASALVTSTSSLLDVGPAAWGASGLWLWGDTYAADAAMKATAGSIGALVKAWVEAIPARFAEQQWAMTGAVPFYGVVESYMKEHPTELVPWVTEYAPKLGGWVDESTPVTPDDWTDWRNAWNAWNMHGQFAAAAALGPTAGSANGQTADDILTKLVAQAGSTTGAIPGSEQRPDTEAESWITAYLFHFGLLEVVEEPTSGDAGVVDGGAGEAGTRDSGTRDAGAKDAATKDSGPKDATATSGRDAATVADAGGAARAGSSGCSVARTGGGGTVPAGEGALLAGAIVLAARRRRPRTLRA